jgi:hypothetical protein
MDGPTSATIAVVDHDGDTDRPEKRARWDAKNKRFVFDHNGRPEPITRERCSERQFHQVNVWAIIQSVLDIYAATWVPGRSASWAFEGNRLIVTPVLAEDTHPFEIRPDPARPGR